MKATIESTTKIVSLTLMSPPVGVPGKLDARVWEGVTERGVRFHAYIVRLAISKDATAKDAEQFEKELMEMRPPSAAVAAIPARLLF